MTKATLTKRTKTNVWDYMAKPEKVWVVAFEDDSWFDYYPTKKAALEDIKGYDIKIVKSF